MSLSSSLECLTSKWFPLLWKQSLCCVYSRLLWARALNLLIRALINIFAGLLQVKRADIGLFDFVNSADLQSFKLNSVDWRSFKPNRLVQVRYSLARFELGSTTPTFITTYCICSGWISMLLNQEFNTNHRRSKDPTHWSTISSPTKTTAIVRSVLIYSFVERF